MKGYWLYYESMGEIFIPESEAGSLTIYSESLQKFADAQLRGLIEETGATVEAYETREDLLSFAAWWIDGDITEGNYN